MQKKIVYILVLTVALSLLWALTGCASDEIPTPQMIESMVTPVETKTPPPAPTSDAIIVSEATATPTSQPVETVTPTGTPEDYLGPLVGPLMLLDEFPENTGWYLWDMGSNQVRKIDDGTGFARFYHFYSWLNGGCELMMSHADHAIMAVDTTGKDLRRIFDYDLLPSYEYGKIYNYKPSPGDQQWILYYIGSGEYTDGYFRGSYEFLNLEVLSSDGSQGPYRLTDNGGASLDSAVWSNNGSKIAYTQTLENGKVWVLLSSPDGKDRTQLWQLPEDRQVFTITWSPDERYILVSHGNESNESYGLSIIDQQGQAISYIEGSSGAQWWLDDQTAVVAFFSPEEGLHGYAYMNITTGEIAHFVPKQTPYGYMLGPEPFPDAPLKIGFFVSIDFREYFIYDVETGQYQVIPTPISLELDGWHLGPLSFPGELACGAAN
jgi:hypothetical protein